MDNIRKLLIINVILAIIYQIIPIITEVERKTFYEEINQKFSIEESVEKVKNYDLSVDTDLRKKSNLSASDYDSMLKNTALYGLGNAFEEAEQTHNVNGLYLVGLACLESAYGTSGYARNRNNLVGWNAVDSNPNKASYFDSKEECILFVASKLKTNYLTENGAYFEGYSARAIDVHYCTDKLHADKIVNIVNNLTKKIEEV